MAFATDTDTGIEDKGQINIWPEIHAICEKAEVDPTFVRSIRMIAPGTVFFEMFRPNEDGSKYIIQEGPGKGNVAIEVRKYTMQTYQGPEAA